jgi:SAM-dependent methyltransferase
MKISPSLYHAHHIKFTTDIPFWLRLAQEQGSPVLELGCGTGRVLVPMIQAGHHAYGLDHDLGMLAFLRDHLATEIKTPLPIFQADITAYSLTARFPFILMPCNTYSTLDTSTRSAALSNVHHHLSPNGVFGISAPNPLSLAQLAPRGESLVETSFTHPVDGNPVQVISDWEATTQCVRFIWHYDHLFPDGKVERNSTYTSHLLTTTETYLQEFNEAGFSNIKTFGDFNFQPYQPQAPHLIILAQRG